MHDSKLKFHVVLVVFFVCAAVLSSTAQAQLELETIATGLTRPIYVTSLPNDSSRLFIVEQAGRILLVKNGVLQGTPFLDIISRVDSSANEEGLLGLAFHPNYETNGFFYVNYINTTGSRVTRISRFSAQGTPATADTADPASETTLLTYTQPQGNHNGGMITFGPNDGYLYISAGDGGGSNDRHGTDGNGQSLDTLLGKILRIDVDAASPYIPASNPFVGNASAMDEIWAYGLRNPWRFSFDRSTGDLYIGDVGQNQVEEIDFQPFSSTGGENYGWRIFEASRCNDNIVEVNAADCAALAPNAVFPIYEYDNPATGQSICGGYVYRGSAIPSLQGTFFFADSILTHVWSFRYDGSTVTNFQERTTELDPDGSRLSAMSSFGEDADGELYIVTLFPGGVFKIVQTGTVAKPVAGMPVTGIIGIALIVAGIAFFGVAILRK